MLCPGDLKSLSFYYQSFSRYPSPIPSSDNSPSRPTRPRMVHRVSVAAAQRAHRKPTLLPFKTAASIRLLTSLRASTHTRSEAQARSLRLALLTRRLARLPPLLGLPRRSPVVGRTQLERDHPAMEQRLSGVLTRESQASQTAPTTRRSITAADYSASFLFLPLRPLPMEPGTHSTIPRFMDLRERLLPRAWVQATAMVQTHTPIRSIPKIARTRFSRMALAPPIPVVYSRIHPPATTTLDDFREPASATPMSARVVSQHTLA